MVFQHYKCTNLNFSLALSNAVIDPPIFIRSFIYIYICQPPRPNPPSKNVGMLVEYQELEMILACMFSHSGCSIYAGQHILTLLKKIVTFFHRVKKMFCLYLKYIKNFCIIFLAFTDVCNTSLFNTICESISLLFTASSRSLREMLW